MLRNKVTGIAEAISHVESGMSVAIGGFLTQGDPLTLIRALRASEVTDLTIYSCTGGFKNRGVVELVILGKVRKLVCSHVGTTPDVVKAYHAGDLDLQLVPQGTLAEQLRAGGAGLGGFLTPTGVGTVVENDKQVLEVEGKLYLLEHSIRADVALVRAHDGDSWGNLRYRGTAGNYNAVCATCADFTIAEVEFLYNPGEISPESVHTPGIYVDSVVRADLTYCSELLAPC